MIGGVKPADVLRTLLLLLAPACGPGATEVAEEPTRPPNVVLIVVDDPGHADFGPDPEPGFEIPSMASIAAEGARFEQAYACAAVCGPARAGLLTGRYPQRFGFEYNPPRLGDLPSQGLPPGEVTLAEALRERGYRTIAVGKWHLGQEDHDDPLGCGFDEFWGFLGGSRRYFTLREHRWNRTNRILDGREPVPEDFEYLTEEFGDRAAEAIERHRDRPFFLYLAFNALHTPMHAPDERLEAVEGIEGGDRRTLAAMTASLDDAVGEVLAALDRNGLREDTLVVLTGDHGGSEENAADNSPLRGHKGEFHEGGIRVPLFVRWPGVVAPGSRPAPPVSHLDLFPTVLAAAGGDSAELDHPLDGVDLRPLLRGEEQEPPHEALYWRWEGEGDRALRKGPYKLVRHGDGPYELYHLERDPTESVDLAPGDAERVGELEEVWREWDEELAEPAWVRFRPDDE